MCRKLDSLLLLLDDEDALRWLHAGRPLPAYPIQPAPRSEHDVEPAEFLA